MQKHMCVCVYIYVLTAPFILANIQYEKYELCLTFKCTKKNFFYWSR